MAHFKATLLASTSDHRRSLSDVNIVQVHIICFGLSISVSVPSSSTSVFPRRGFLHLPSPQTPSLAGSSIRWSLVRSLSLCLNVKRRNIQISFGNNTSTLSRLKVPSVSMLGSRFCSFDRTWHFESSKRHLHRCDVVVVDETGTSFEVFHYTMGSPYIPTDAKVDMRKSFI